MTSSPGCLGEAYCRDNGQLEDLSVLRYATRPVSRYVGRGSLPDFGCGAGHLAQFLSGRLSMRHGTLESSIFVRSKDF